MILKYLYIYIYIHIVFPIYQALELNVKFNNDTKKVIEFGNVKVKKSAVFSVYVGNKLVKELKRSTIRDDIKNKFDSFFFIKQSKRLLPEFSTYIIQNGLSSVPKRNGTLLVVIKF